MKKYKSDADIEKEFDNIEVVRIEKGRTSGCISCIAPAAGDHVAGGASEFTDYYIVYDTGVVAFDNWYPDSVYNYLVREICNAPEGTTVRK